MNVSCFSLFVKRFSLVFLAVISLTMIAGCGITGPRFCVDFGMEVGDAEKEEDE